MARRFRVVVEYDGTDFSGWQRQVEERTVQGTLEDALRAMTGESVFVRGAGRTDAGVHADGQVATFEIGVNIPPHGLLRGLNSALYDRGRYAVKRENGVHHFHMLLGEFLR